MDRPVLEIDNTTLSYGRGLTNKVPLNSIKFATDGGPVMDTWIGSASVLLEMEPYVSEGQRYYDRKSIELFCVDTPTAEIVDRINALIQEAKCGNG